MSYVLYMYMDHCAVRHKCGSGIIVRIQKATVYSYRCYLGNVCGLDTSWREVSSVDITAYQIKLSEKGLPWFCSFLISFTTFTSQIAGRNHLKISGHFIVDLSACFGT